MPTTETDRPITRYWLQMTTGKLHKRRNCGITQRTRYDHAYVDLSPAEAAQYAKCKRCFS